VRKDAKSCTFQISNKVHLKSQTWKEVGVIKRGWFGIILHRYRRNARDKPSDGSTRKKKLTARLRLSFPSGNTAGKCEAGLSRTRSSTGGVGATSAKLGELKAKDSSYIRSVRERVGARTEFRKVHVYIIIGEIGPKSKAP